MGLNNYKNKFDEEKKSSGKTKVEHQKSKIANLVRSVICGVSITSGATMYYLSDTDNGINQKLFSSSYDDFIRKNLEKLNKNENGIAYIYDGLCSDSIISKNNNLPYECVPIYGYKDGKIYDIVYINKNIDFKEKNEIISIREMLQKNYCDDNNKCSEYLDSILNNIYYILKDEDLLKGSGMDFLRKMPTYILEKIKGSELSLSAMRVKSDSIKDYSEEEIKEMLEKLATFKIIPAYRDRGIFYSGELEKIDGYDKEGYIEIYKLYGYKNKEEFKKDFLDGKIRTDGELGFAMGTIIVSKIKEKTFISNDYIKTVKEDLEKIGIKLSDPRFNRSEYLLNSDYIYLEELTNKIDSRVSNYYPVNVNASIEGSKLQTF